MEHMDLGIIFTDILEEAIYKAHEAGETKMVDALNELLTMILDGWYLETIQERRLLGRHLFDILYNGIIPWEEDYYEEEE